MASFCGGRREPWLGEGEGCMGKASHLPRTEPVVPARPEWAQRRPCCPVLPDLPEAQLLGKYRLSGIPCLGGDSVSEVLQPVLACLAACPPCPALPSLPSPGPFT